MADQRLPIVNSDDGTWGDIIRQYLMKEHFNDDANNPANGGHQFVTVRAGTASKAPLTLTSGTLLTTPAIGSIEFNGDKLYFTQTTSTTRKTVAIYDDSSGATGDVYYRNSGGSFTRLGIGGNNQVLTVASGLPAWQSPAVQSTFSDSSFTLQDSLDTTKKAMFDVPASQATGTTRVITLPATDATLATQAGIETLTNKTLTDPKINTIKDTNGSNILALTPYTSAANWIEMGNSVAGDDPYLEGRGTDTNVGIYLCAKGAAAIRIWTYAGNTPTIAASGEDSNLDLNLTSRGTGAVKANGTQVATISDAQTLTNKNIIMPGVASPSYAQGRLVYDTDNESLTFYNNNANVSLQIGQEEWIRVVNNSGGSIPNGSAVYISGASSGLPTIALARANAASTTVCVGLTTDAIPNNSMGYVTSIGSVRGINTSSFTAGQTVYLSSSAAGGLTTTAPSAPNYRYRVGIVGVADTTTGTIHVTPSTAALGNGTANQLFGMNTAGTAQEVKSIVGATNDITVDHTANTITLSLGSNAITATSITTMTNKSLVDAKMNSIKDSNGNYIVGFSPAANAVNYAFIQNSAAGGGPAFGAIGADTNIPLFLAPKGAAAVSIFTSTGVTPTLLANGTDTNLDLNFASKGTGKVTANGIEVATVSGTQTLTNKRITPRVVAVASSATPSVNTDAGDHFNLLSLSTNITSFGASGTPTDGQKMMIRIKDDGTVRTIVWSSSFQSSGVAALLSTTAVGKTHHVAFVYDTAIAKWVCLAVDEFGY